MHVSNGKNMKKKNIISLVLIVSLLVLGIWYLGVILRPTDTDGAYGQVESFHSMKENSMDVIVYGSSHAYRGFDTTELYKNYGIAAYNYAWNWQKMNTTKAFIKDSLNCQNPKVVLIESYYAYEVLTDSEINAEIYFSRYLHDKKAVNDYVKECLGDNLKTTLGFYVPLYAFHDNWIDISLTSLKLPENYNNTSSLGFCGSDAVYEITLPTQNKKPQQAFSQEAINNLNEIVNLCREKGIDVIFYTAPFDWEYEYADAMEEYCNSVGCKYFNSFDYLDEIGIDGSTDFADDGHLNTSGAKKIANFIGKYLIENYEFEDQRENIDSFWYQNVK